MDITSKIHKECDGYSFGNLVVGVSDKGSAVLLNLGALSFFMFKNISNHISSKAITGKWKAKNNQDHIVLKNNWTKNILYIFSNALYAEIDMNK